MTLATAVIDTADWALAVPMQQATGEVLDFSGTLLTVALTPIQGGPPIAAATSADGSLTFIADASTPHFTINLRVADRTWRIGRPTQVCGDILRHPDPGDMGRIEWLGRVTFLVLPGSNSSGIVVPSQAPVLTRARPYDGRIVTSALAVGPQGPPGGGNGDETLAVTAAQTISGHRVARGTADGIAVCGIADLADAGTAIGITEGAALAGAPATVRYGGLMTDTTWAWAQGPVFVGLDGLLTQTPPRAAYEQQVGTAISATQIVIDIEPAFVFTP